MLRIYPVVLTVLESLQPVLGRIELEDRDLARQLRRCSASVRNARYHTATDSTAPWARW